MYKLVLKSILDFSFSLLLLLIFCPLFILVSFLLFFTNKGKVFFVQARPGKNEKIFNIIKFKTMNDKRDKNGNLLPDFKRLTYVGKLVRKTSIDELPQLLNVLKGDMSLIGPRPLLVEYLLLYNDFQKRRHNVKPGITGWAQVNGRNAISLEEKFELDVWYVDNISFFLDVKIVLFTIVKLIIAENINASTCITMNKFTGNNIN